MNERTMIVLSLVGAVATGASAKSEEKFQKLAGAQIQAKIAGMELTDQVHWDDFYQQNGVLVTNEMGHKTSGKWRIEKDQLCLDRGRELGSGCFEVWISGKNVQLRNRESSLPLEGVLEKSKARP
jgi:hypothetical protein